jgi:zinc finger protein 830
MSAAFKLSKKKVSQHDLRRLMQESKQTRSNADDKIDSPFAKYENDKLICQLCKKEVRSAAVWKVHINSKQHKENLVLAKQLKEKLENQNKPPTTETRVASLKRSIEVWRAESEVPEKKLKGILKNSSTSSVSPTSLPQHEVLEKPHTNGSATTAASTSSSITADFFDSKPKTNGTEKAASTSKQQNEDKMQVDEALPEGFFDDPMKDAKARNIEYKNPTEEEWDKFQKEIKEAEAQSMTIINDEQEEATVERQIDEIDAQMRNWSRFVCCLTFKLYFLTTFLFLLGCLSWKRRRNRLN